MADPNPSSLPRDALRADGWRWLSIATVLLFGALLAVHWANKSDAWSRGDMPSSSAAKPAAVAPVSRS
jgi:hypothetical protein